MAYCPFRTGRVQTQWNFQPKSMYRSSSTMWKILPVTTLFSGSPIFGWTEFRIVIKFIFILCFYSHRWILSYAKALQRSWVAQRPPLPEPSAAQTLWQIHSTWMDHWPQLREVKPLRSIVGWSERWWVHVDGGRRAAYFWGARSFCWM